MNKLSIERQEKIDKILLKQKQITNQGMKIVLTPSICDECNGIGHDKLCCWECEGTGIIWKDDNKNMILYWSKKYGFAVLEDIE